MKFTLYQFNNLKKIPATGLELGATVVVGPLKKIPATGLELGATVVVGQCATITPRALGDKCGHKSSLSFALVESELNLYILYFVAKWNSVLLK